MLSYFLLGPPIASAVFLSVLAIGTMTLEQWSEAFFPFVGIASVVAALPALFTGMVAAIAGRAKRWWLRLILPAAAAAVASCAIVIFVVRQGEPPDGVLLATTLIASLGGAFVPWALTELLRKPRGGATR